LQLAEQIEVTANTRTLGDETDCQFPSGEQSTEYGPRYVKTLLGGLVGICGSANHDWAGATGSIPQVKPCKISL
jgi:hypothetical protein